MDDPVDPDKFYAAAATFNAAYAESPANAGGKPIAHLTLDGQPIALMDVPFNRAVMAVKKALRRLGVDDAVAYLWRLTALQSLLEDDTNQFGDLVVGDASGHHRIAPGLMHAAAVVKLTDKDPDRPGAFDPEDLLQAAREYEHKNPSAARH